MLTYTIRKNEYGEFVVRFSINGKRMLDMNYYTDDRTDAQQTAQDMVTRWQQLESESHAPLRF